MQYSRQLLSASANGRPIKVDQTTIASGTVVHTAVAGVVSYDEVYLWASNLDNADRLLTLGFGGVTDPDDLILKDYLLPANCGPYPLCTGQSLQNALSVYAAADVANVVTLTGHVNRAV